jgi:hypothetical protein
LKNRGSSGNSFTDWTPVHCGPSLPAPSTFGEIVKAHGVLESNQQFGRIVVTL